MTLAAVARADRYLRSIRRGMVVVPALAALVGALTLVVALDPAGGISRALPRLVVAAPVARTPTAGLATRCALLLVFDRGSDDAG